MLIIKNEADIEKCMSPCGNAMFKLNREEIEALLDGKMLGDQNFDEYGLFIFMEDNDHAET